MKTRKKKAFALVLALAMMGFMVLLIITLATMVQMQMRLSRQNIINEQAKQAAKFAAYQAMSAVQVAMGPDQRVSANAMILDNNLANEITKLDEDSTYNWWETPMDIPREEVEAVEDESLSQNRYWVGVWDSKPGFAPTKFLSTESRAGYSDRMQETALTWLVSGNIKRGISDVAGSDITHKPSQILEAKDFVRAVSKGSYLNEILGDMKDTDVRAPLVVMEKDVNAITGDTIEDGKETRIAWWVADEGQKAPLNAVAPKEILAHAKNISFREQSLPFYSGIHALTVSNFGNRAGPKAFELEFDDDDPQSGSLARIRNLDDIKSLDIVMSQNVSTATLPSRVFFHAASFNTKGVIVNTREGGLKRDLTLGLIREDNENEPEEPKDAETTTGPKYFEFPYGVAGYYYKTSTAYPLFPSNGAKRNSVLLSYNELGTKGHIFGPQQFGHEDVGSKGIGFKTASAISSVKQYYSDINLVKDPGGPLWDQLRSYYNLRTNDDGSKTLKVRPSTDDRHGFKPVVKRFQVFFVPSFVNYGTASYNPNDGTNKQYDYGVRIHMIPVLVLWNPYDANMAGDTYYVIRMTNLKWSNCLGTFRIAVGWNTNSGKFQCLRDLRTEKMPVVAKEQSLGLSFVLRNYNLQGDNYLREGLLDIKGISQTITATTDLENLSLTRKTYWYENRRYPLGYGEKAEANFGSGGSATRTRYIYNVPNSNVKVYDLDGKGTSTEPLAIRSKITKIPLFLNNLYVSVAQGSYDTMHDGSSFYGFNKQQDIDEQDPWSGHANVRDRCDYVVGDLHFVAYDKTGIPAGKAKVFAMKKVINYIGNVRQTQKNNRYQGPNGDILKYEERGAMLHGLDDGGEMGSCFYLDVPHPEIQHLMRYRGRTNLADNKSEYVLFNLQELRNTQISNDPSKVHAPDDIGDICIDLQPIVGIWVTSASGSNNGISNYPFNSNLSATPHFYGMASLFPMGKINKNYLTDQIRNQDYHDGSGHQAPWVNNTNNDSTRRSYGDHWRMYMQVYIWKYGNGTKISDFGRIYVRGGSYQGNPYWQQLDTLPTMTYVNGMRPYLTYKKQSFPDPCFTPSSGEVNSGSKNFFQAGTTVSNGDYTSLAAFGNYKIMEDNLEKVNLRYFLNWSLIDIRRHSANSWNNSGSNTQIMDLPPAAQDGLYVATYNNNAQYSYGNLLHRHIINSSNNQQPPYGYVFGQPYVRDAPGFQPMFNRRIFVNGQITSTSFDREMSPRQVDFGDNEVGGGAQKVNTTYNDIGRMQRAAQGTCIVFNTARGKEGMSEVGYDISESGGYMSVGTSPTNGNSNMAAPTHHLLRETEVVSNPAALSAASLSFGVGSVYVGWYTTSSDISRNLQAFYEATSGIQANESLQTTFAIGNSLCPSRVAPERAHEIGWIDGSQYWYDQSGSAFGEQSDGKRNGDVGDKTIIYDMSYQLNNILWDEYFFSTLPYRQNEFASSYNETNYVIPQNPRLEYYVSDSEKLTSDDLRSVERVDQYTQNAAKIWINGPFNVNSTSIDAWKAVLATYYGVTVRGYNSGAANNSMSAPFHRWSAPWSANPFNSGSSISNETRMFDGFRTLDDDELEILAAAIVEHVKDRGPFYSMSDFVNRVVDYYPAETRYNNEQLGKHGYLNPSYTDERRFSYVPTYKNGDDRSAINDGSKSVSTDFKHKINHLQKGVLQAAIDSTSINYAFHKDDRLNIKINVRNMSSAYTSESNQDSTEYDIFQNVTDTWENWRGAIGPQLTGAPTYLMQQDILSRIGSFLTVRSDTFKIRAYGEVRNPLSGIVEGKAWCEMVVQRVPEYIAAHKQDQEPWRVSEREFEIGTQGGLRSSTGENLDEVLDELDPLNKTLGRRFKVVSFKWLNHKEI